MSPHLLGIIISVGLAAIGVLGDYFLKLASVSDNVFRSPWFYLGFVTYASTAIGWVFVMRSLSFAEIGIIFSVATVLLITAVGVFVLKEPISNREIAGVLCAVSSVVLLARTD